MRTNGVLVRPHQDLDVRRGRSTDGRPVDSLEPVLLQPTPFCPTLESGRRYAADR